MKYYLKKFGDSIDINVQNLSGVTPLHLASYSGHLYVVKFLVEQPKIDIFKKDDNGTLPLAYGANNPQIVAFLCNIKGIDINCQNFQGNSFLHFAARRGNTEAVKILLNIKGINVNLKNEILLAFFLFIEEFDVKFFLNETPLKIALRKKREIIVQLLQKCGGTI